MTGNYGPPPWLLKAVRDAMALQRQIEQYQSMIRDAQRYTEQIQRAAPIIEAAQRYADQVRAMQSAAGPALMAHRQALELAQVLGLGLRQFLLIPSVADVSVLGPTAGADVGAPAGSVVVSDEGAATDTLTVEKATQDDVGMPLDARTIFLAFLWVCTILLPLKIGLLPPEVQTIIRDYVSTVSLTLTVHWRLTDTRKRKHD